MHYLYSLLSLDQFVDESTGIPKAVKTRMVPLIMQQDSRMILQRNVEGGLNYLLMHFPNDPIASCFMSPVHSEKGLEGASG